MRCAAICRRWHWLAVQPVFGHHRLVTGCPGVGDRGPRLSWPMQSTVTVSRPRVAPTVVRGRVIWHLGYTEDASAAALTVLRSVLHTPRSSMSPRRGSGGS